MDSFQQDTESFNALQNSGKSSTSDIQFEDGFDVNDIQNKLNLNDDDFSTVEKSLEEVPEKPQNLPLPASSGENKNTKKYVIYIDSENVDYIENLSIKERKSVINRVLKDENAKGIAKREAIRKNKFIAHIILACLTFIVSIPLIFILINKATEISINNYKGARHNFSQLYKDNGKIQMNR